MGPESLKCSNSFFCSSYSIVNLSIFSFIYNGGKITHNKIPMIIHKINNFLAMAVPIDLSSSLNKVMDRIFGYEFCPEKNRLKYVPDQGVRIP